MDYEYSYNIVGGGFALLLAFVIWVAIWVGLSWLMYWKVFEKAGREPWKGLIPIYQYYVMVQIIGRPTWWFWVLLAGFIGSFIPILNFIAWIAPFVLILMISLDMAKCFGKSSGFGIGLWLLSIIFYPILGFGDAQYIGPVATVPVGGGMGTPPPPPPAGGVYAPPPAPPAPPAQPVMPQPPVTPQPPVIPPQAAPQAAPPSAPPSAPPAAPPADAPPADTAPQAPTPPAPPAAPPAGSPPPPPPLQ